MVPVPVVVPFPFHPYQTLFRYGIVTVVDETVVELEHHVGHTTVLFVDVIVV